MLAPAAIALAAYKRGSAVVYVASLILTSTLCVVALRKLLFLPHLAWTMTLPVGLPWLGAHFRLAAEHVKMPAPGDIRPAVLTVTLHDLVWDFIYAPVSGAIGFAADKLSHLQFLTIRQYLSLVFAALTTLLFFLMLVMLVWS